MAFFKALIGKNPFNKAADPVRQDAREDRAIAQPSVEIIFECANDFQSADKRTHFSVDDPKCLSTRKYIMYRPLGSELYTKQLTLLC